MTIEHIHTNEPPKALNADKKINLDTPKDFYEQDGHVIAQFLIHSIPATTMSCALKEINRFRELQQKKKDKEKSA